MSWNKKIGRENITDIFITVLILLIADNPIVSENKYFKLFVLIFLLIIFLYRRKVHLDKEIFFIIIIVFLVILLQAFKWGIDYFTVMSYIGLTILTPYIAIKLIGIRYLEITSHIIVIISWYSIILFSFQLLIPGFSELLLRISTYFDPVNSLQVRPSIFFYSVAYNSVKEIGTSDIIRNAGMFHEPGAYAVFIDLALSINLLKKRKFFTTGNIVLLLAMITTFSTAGYVSTMLIFGIYIISLAKTRSGNVIFYIIVFLVFTFVSYNLFKLPFMGDKIKEHAIYESSADLNEPTTGRILGARKALVVLSRYPITGRGLIHSSRVYDFTSDEAAGYGYLAFFSQFGIFISVLYLLFFIRGLVRVSFKLSGNKRYWWFLFAALSLNLLSQSFMGRAFFIMVFYLGLLNEFNYKQYKTK